MKEKSPRVAVKKSLTKCLLCQTRFRTPRKEQASVNRLPNGIKLQLYRREVREFPAPIGSHSAPISAPIGLPLYVQGWWDANKQAPAHTFERCTYALTNCNRDWIDLWLKQNPDSALIESKVLVICNSHSEAAGVANELMQDNHLSGLEPMEMVAREEGETTRVFLARIKDPRIKNLNERGRMMTASVFTPNKM